MQAMSSLMFLKRSHSKLVVHFNDAEQQLKDTDDGVYKLRGDFEESERKLAVANAEVESLM